MVAEFIPVVIMIITESVLSQYSHSSNKYFLSTYYLLGSVLCTRAIAMNKINKTSVLRMLRQTP